MCCCWTRRERSLWETGPPRNSFQRPASKRVILPMSRSFPRWRTRLRKADPSSCSPRSGITFEVGTFLHTPQVSSHFPHKPGCQASTLTAAKSRSEEHTSELQSPDQLVCRLLLEKKKQSHTRSHTHKSPHYSYSPE